LGFCVGELVLTQYIGHWIVGSDWLFAGKGMQHTGSPFVASIPEGVFTVFWGGVSEFNVGLLWRLKVVLEDNDPGAGVEGIKSVRCVWIGWAQVWACPLKRTSHWSGDLQSVDQRLRVTPVLRT
jgi:hypothetical protein